MYRYGILYRYRYGTIYRYRYGIIYRYRYGTIYRYRYGIIYRYRCSIIYMYGTSWFIKVWFCNGRSSPVRGRTCTVLSVLYDYITMLCTNITKQTLRQSHYVILHKTYRAETSTSQMSYRL